MYNVGARNESPELTGIAHLFEHLMFGGSANVPEFDRVLSDAGGISNAWTSNDFTNFYEIAPQHNAETLFYIESDRMLAPGISQSTLDIQKSVVIEEFKQQCLNTPYGDMMHKLRAMVYGNHPYSWPVIGKRFEHIENVSRDDMIEWWKNHYSPDNAVLAVAGKIDFETAYEYALKWFGDIEPRPIKPIPHVEIPQISTLKPEIVYGDVPATLITIAYLMDSYGTDKYLAADAITDILASGRASRFFQSINMNPASPVMDAEASITGSEDRGLLMLTGRLANEDINPDEATEYLINVARSIITEGVSEHELQRLKNRQQSVFVMSNMSCISCAMTIAEAEIHNEYPGERLDQYQALKVQDIITTAREIFDGTNPAILYYRPKMKIG